MATYDQPALHYDGAVFFDAPPPIPNNPRTKMAKSKLENKSKTDTEIIAFAETHEAAMAGNPNYVTPSPDAAAFNTRIETFKTALTAAGTAEATARQKTAQKDAERLLLEQALTERAGYVDAASKGDEAKILSAGFPVRSAATPPAVPPVPVNFSATMGDHEGEMDLHWTPSKGAKSYILECSTYAVPRTWTQVKVTTRSSMTVTGLAAGGLFAFRVKAIGSAGDSDWSDETVERAP